MVKILHSVRMYLKYTIVFIILLVVGKWAIFIYSEHAMKERSSKVSAEVKIEVKRTEESRQVEIAYHTLLPKAEKTLEKSDQEIAAYIDERLKIIESNMVYGLTREDGFLDWIYGWGTGWKIAGNAIFGCFSDKDKVKMLVEKHFHELVTDSASMHAQITQINDFTKRRLDEFYVTVLDMVGKKTKVELHRTGISLERVEVTQIPWGKYAIQGVLDTGGLSAVGFGAGSLGSKVALGKIAGGKSASMISAKISSIVGAKVTSSVASIAVDVASLGIGIAVDYLFSEGYEALNRDEDEKKYRRIIHELVYGELAKSLHAYRKEVIDTAYGNIKEELAKKVKVVDSQR